MTAGPVAEDSVAARLRQIRPNDSNITLCLLHSTGKAPDGRRKEQESAAKASGESLKLEADRARLNRRLRTSAPQKPRIGAVIFGQTGIERASGHCVGGHVPLWGAGPPNQLGTMGIALGLDARRIQFTPDLMPSDILGTEVLEENPGGKRSFRFIAGPVFAQLLMADEINRASPRTQSALLQAMPEQHVTVAGARHDLPKPFHVLATQNPLEQEGTYPLPEAQLDRFLMEIDVDYPDQEAERRILFDTTGADETRAKVAMTADDLAAQRGPSAIDESVVGRSWRHCERPVRRGRRPLSPGSGPFE